MPVFYGELQVEGDTQRLPAVVTIDKGLLRLQSGRAALGEWKLYQIGLEPYTDRSVLLAAEDERLVLFLDDHDGFMRETEHFRNNPDRRRSREKLHPAFAQQQEEESLKDLTDEVREDFAREVNPIVDEARDMLEAIEPGPPLYIALGVLFLLLIFLPGVLAGIAGLVAVVALIAGGLAFADSKIAVRIPDPFTPTNLIIVGALALLLAAMVVVIR